MVEIFCYNDESEEYEFLAQTDSGVLSLTSQPSLFSTPDKLSFENLLFKEAESLVHRFETKKKIGQQEDGSPKYKLKVYGEASSLEESFPAEEELEIVINYIINHAEKKKYDIATFRFETCGISNKDNSLILVSCLSTIAYFSRYSKSLLRVGKLGANEIN